MLDLYQRMLDEHLPGRVEGLYLTGAAAFGELDPRDIPGPVQPVLDDRKRQEASAFIWAHVTQGELRFAPRPIEARQPGPVRRNWAARRGTTWFQLTRPDPLTHYADLRKLLIQHAKHLAAAAIDTTA